ncbi:SpoIIE family protein phosphatase [Pseudoflavonifractor phocaeensis]|uniref:SpoIIE family protein phosphatase n=1 Tax=Pseudoflavonifractor phocaeensis TaxID=1870988 RepID=UPI0019573E25|nr:SpoIIE family protein phosphatase [Pseudoflavonifractor phocaeensis]MBM6869156.1 SpoIIE family protein phosphatase [Pseudoflavonifractor phocaeensis]
MATKDSLRSRAARMGEEMRETGKLVLRAPALVRTAECAMHFLLGALLSGAEIFGGYAPFGLGLVAASGAGADGLFALLGACFGYFSFQGFLDGLRYSASAILIYSVAFAFYGGRLSRRGWFAPLAAALVDAVTGAVYLSDTHWYPSDVIFFSTEVLLVAASAYFCRIAFSPWKAAREEEPLTVRQTISLLLLGGTVLMTLSKVTILDSVSLGRAAAALAVLLCASAGGMGAGAAVGVAAGVGMDLSSEGVPFYAMAYALAGVMSGAFHRQGRMAVAMAYVLSNALAVLWSWDNGLHLSLLYEVFVASVLFLLTPKSVLRRIQALLVRETRQDTKARAMAYARRRLEETAQAFRDLHSALRPVCAGGRNDNDTAVIFDRAASRVCRTCSLQIVCWQRDYVSTYNALNDALPAMLERGHGEGEDFPGYFSDRCQKFPQFLAAANEELSALFTRRQYQSRIKDNRGEVCRQYGALAAALGAAAAELSAELAPDPGRERRLRQHLTAQGLECDCAVFYDERGRLRVEADGPGAGQLRKPEEVHRLSGLLSVPLRPLEEEGRRDRAVLVQLEPYQAVAGVAARKKEGETVSGDTGAWFKGEDGKVYVLLCDGMGSGPDANRESGEVVDLLEKFLRAGVSPEEALRTLSGALSLKGEETGSFTTIDLLALDLFTGSAAVYKFGAAPTYVKKGATVTRVTGASLPAGLAPGGTALPDISRFQLSPGDCVLMVTDGVAGSGGDVWLRERLRSFDGSSPKEIARILIDESSRRGGGEDDRTALLLRLDKRSK